MLEDRGLTPRLTAPHNESPREGGRLKRTDNQTRVDVDLDCDEDKRQCTQMYVLCGVVEGQENSLTKMAPLFLHLFQFRQS